MLGDARKNKKNFLYAQNISYIDKIIHILIVYIFLYFYIFYILFYILSCKCHLRNNTF